MIICKPDQVELDSEYNSQIAIEWEEREQKEKSVGCIFKLKTNNLQSIEAKPTHGLILLGKNPQQICIKIKYKGHLIEIDRAKLKIQWINLQEKDLLRIKEIPNISLPIIFKALRNQLPNCNKSHTVNFTLQKEGDNDYDIQEFRFEETNSKIAELPSIKDEYNQRVLSLQKGGIYRISHAQNNSENTTEKQNNPSALFSSPVSILFLIALGFFLGVSFGIKTQPFPFSYDI